MEDLLKFANEINNDWDSSYTASVIENRLVVILNGKEVASLDDRFQIEGEDDDAVEQLEFMANR